MRYTRLSPSSVHSRSVGTKQEKSKKKWQNPTKSRIIKLDKIRILHECETNPNRRQIHH